jgi:NifU-like protein involved in Fe-S cluster formation
VSPGWPRQLTRKGPRGPNAASGRCIPILHGLRHVGAENPFSHHWVSTYIFVCSAEAIRRFCIVGKTSMLNEVYNSRILELAGNIPRLGRLPAPDATATAHSKLCGSTVTVDLKMDGGAVADFAHDVKACALGQASSSIMARHVIGAKPAELRELRETVHKMLKENGPPPSGKWADIAVLEPVRDYKARHASTLLTFDAVVSALDQIEAKSGNRRAQAAE